RFSRHLDTAGVPQRHAHRRATLQEQRHEMTADKAGSAEHRHAAGHHLHPPQDLYPIGGRDRETFPEFYGEYDARVLANARAAGRAIVTGAITYTGTAELQRDIANLKAVNQRGTGTRHQRPIAT